MQQPADPESADRPGEASSAEAPGRSRFSPFNFLIGFGAGTFVGVALALLAFLVANDAEPAQRVTAVVQPDEPIVIAGTPQPTPDIRPKTKAALDVRLGPGNGFAVIGLIARGEAVEVVGRDNDSQWLAIRFPPGSAARGWVPVSGVDPAPDLTALAVALPTPLPRTVVTLPAAPAFNGGNDTGTGASIVPTATPNPALLTPTPRAGPPDLVVTNVRLLSDRRVSVTVANRGPGDLVGFTVFVVVRDLASRSEMVSAAIASLLVGGTVTLETSNFRITGEMTIQAIADPFGSIPEADRTNNMLEVVLAAPVPPTPTWTPLPEGF